MKTSGIYIFQGFFFCLFICMITGCGGGAKSGDDYSDTPTSGKFKIGVDNSYSLLIDAELYLFQSLYTSAKIDTLSRSEADIMDAFMKDSVSLIVVNRTLTEAEENALKARTVYPITTKIAYDAVTFIVNRENPDSTLFYDQIENIFKGKVKTWKEVNPKSKLTDLKLIFDNFKSCNTRYFREKFNLDKLPDVCFAVSTNAEVINFVERNKAAIGVISANWISDKADTVSHGFLKRIRVVAISSPGSNNPSGNFYTPHPGYIAEGFYPFTRTVYCINRQSYTGLAYGLSSFIAGEKGQYVVLHSGMVPAAQPVRLVEIKH